MPRLLTRALQLKSIGPVVEMPLPVRPTPLMIGASCERSTILGYSVTSPWALELSGMRIVVEKWDVPSLDSVATAS